MKGLGAVFGYRFGISAEKLGLGWLSLTKIHFWTNVGPIWNLQVYNNLISSNSSPFTPASHPSSQTKPNNPFIFQKSHLKRKKKKSLKNDVKGEERKAKEEDDFTLRWTFFDINRAELFWKVTNALLVYSKSKRYDEDTGRVKIRMRRTKAWWKKRKSFRHY